MGARKNGKRLVAAVGEILALLVTMLLMMNSRSSASPYPTLPIPVSGLQGTGILSTASPSTPGAPSTQELAFVSIINERAAIFLVDSDGSNVRRLTDGQADDKMPSWSPDGQKIVFDSNRDNSAGDTKLQTEIYSMNADGTEQRRLTRNGYNDFAPVWSPDGRTILFVSDRDGRFQIYKMNTDGTGQRRLAVSDYYDAEPAWSPDGRFVAFSSDRTGSFQIHIMQADGSNVRQLTEGDREHEAGNPSWSPDGKFIVFIGGNYHDFFAIYIMDASGKNQRPLTERNGEAYHPVWSPDGKWIAFSWQVESKVVVKLMNPDGLAVRYLVQFFGEYPAWRPHPKDSMTK